MSCPAIAVLGQNLTFTAQTKNSSNVATDADSVPTYEVYENTTDTAIASGSMAKVNDAGTAGFYGKTIAVTTANGFETYKSYTIRVTATIGGTATVTVYSFTVFFSADVTSGALTTTARFKTYAGITGTDDDTLIAQLISAATSAIEKYCGRTLTSTTYREFYDGTGDYELWTNQTPITAIQLLATGRLDIISITNSNSDAYNAYFTVDSTSLSLVIQGGANDGTSTFTLASYTLSTLVTAINALGTGWTATLLISDYGVWSASQLILASGICAFDPATSYLQIPEDVKSGFKFDGASGRIYLSTGFPKGTQNVILRYTAGETTTPADLEQICIDLVNTYYRSRKRDTSVMAERLGDHAVTYATTGTSGVSYRDISESLQRRLAPYKRFRLPV